ncbi:hypothetical protein HSX11_19420 [Oxalobacteraceae bacterium]|nr:hypothetical protein [Oxalobacteraceae bacterium]
MLVIRQAQMHILAESLAAAQKRRQIEAMAAFLRTQFHAELWVLGHEVLCQRIEETLRTAAGFGIVSERDGCRYLSLAVSYGWDFHVRADLAWMRGMLDDVNAGTPAQRLRRLLGHCIQRSQIEEDNRRLRREGAGGAAISPDSAGIRKDGWRLLLTKE